MRNNFFVFFIVTGALLAGWFYPSLVGGATEPFRSVQKGVVTYRLNISEQPVHFAGKTTRALMVNQSLPAPTLRFKENQKSTGHEVGGNVLFPSYMACWLTIDLETIS